MIAIVRRGRFDYFVKWAANSSDAALKREFYPHLEKNELLKEGCVASPSTHNRGSTVYLTILALLRSGVDHYIPG
jgi:zinc D-Ala-D-Ala dipeptidase